MPYVEIQKRKIYYEVHGEGDVLVILNGIMMSHKSWEKFREVLSKSHKIIFIDFLDQGKSEKMDEPYTQALQVEIVYGVLQHLGVQKIHLLGISYGGEVALQFTLKYGEIVNKLLLFNTTSCTNSWLKDIGKGWISAASTYNPEGFYNVAIPIVYSPMFYTRNREWMNGRKKILYQVFDKAFLEAMIRLIQSAENYDVRDELYKIKQHTLVVSSEYDYLTPIEEQCKIKEGIQKSYHVVISGCGHASMYEKPMEFISLVKGFLGIEKEVNIV